MHLISKCICIVENLEDVEKHKEENKNCPNQQRET